MKNVLTHGVIAGIIGGILFGMMMQMRGMILMVAMMVGIESLAIGWIIHMIISVIFGLAFVLFASKTSNIFIFTLIYGVIIWIVGPLVTMPLMLGMGTNLANAFTPDQLMSLGTHIIFSIIVAIVYTVLSKRSVNVNTAHSA